MKNKILEKLSIDKIICFYIVLSLFFLLVYIYFSPARFIADEKDFVPNIKVLKQYGFSLAFLNNIKGQSPGPLYQYIYCPISNIISLTPMHMRLVNFIFVLSNLYLLYLLLDKNKNKILVPLLFMAIPMTWDVSGLALTEMPSLFFCLLSMYLLKTSLTIRNKSSITLSLFAGLCAGAGIIGRSPFLMLIPASLLLYNLPGRRTETTIFILSSIIFPCIVFYTWRGLVPPDVQGIQSGYQLIYLFICIIYFVVTTFIIYPDLFFIEKLHYYIGSVVITLSLILNVTFFKVRYMPMSGVINFGIIPQVLTRLYPYLFPALAIGCSYIFIISLYFHVQRNKQNIWRLFLFVASLLIVLTTIKSAAHFTSKYVLQAYPFFLLYIANDIKANKYLLLRVVIGTLIGLLTLSGYYFSRTA